MESYYLLTTCAAAFLAVFVLLAVLAVVMRLIQVAFPARETDSGSDAAMFAAIAAAMNSMYPGSTVTKIEEMR